MMESLPIEKYKPFGEEQVTTSIRMRIMMIHSRRCYIGADKAP
jgi:hypothetical protein